MNIPKLQVALDIPDLQKTISVTQKIAGIVDVLEVGTILAVQEGMNAVRTLRSLYPDQVILADIRIIKAGGKLSKLAFDAGANWVTVISDASNETTEAVVSETKAAHDSDVQIEINDSYSDNQLEYWKNLGISQIIFHRSNEVIEEEEKWSEKTLDEVRRLCSMGFKVSITGGLSLDEIKVFKGIPVYCFIVGRKITNADDPNLVAAQYKQEIQNIFN